MAYKRYIKKGGKVYGPYIYHSRKVNGKVVSEYRGTGGNKSHWFFVFIVGLILVLSSFVMLMLPPKNLITESSYFAKSFSASTSSFVFSPQEKFEESLDKAQDNVVKVSSSVYDSAKKSFLTLVGFVSEDDSGGDESGSSSEEGGSDDESSSEDSSGGDSDSGEDLGSDSISEESEGEESNSDSEESEISVLGDGKKIKEKEKKEREKKKEKKNKHEEEAGGGVIGEEESEDLEEEKETEEDNPKESEEVEVEELEEDEVGEDNESVENETGVVEEKVAVCHIPGGDESKAKTIYVSKSAVKAHLAHGDYLGECVEQNETEIVEEVEQNVTDMNETVEQNFTEVDEIIEQNITEFNETGIVNKSIEVITNQTVVNETVVGNDLAIQTTQYSVVINRPVKWKKRVSLLRPDVVKVEIHKQAENITVYKLVAGDKEELFERSIGEGNGETEEVEGAGVVGGEESVVEEEVDNETDIFKDEDIEKVEVSDDSITITGKFVFGGDLSPGFRNLFVRIISALTGRVITTTKTEEIKEITIDEDATEYEIDYDTPAPVATEKEILNGKEIVISSDIHYENVLAYTEMPYEVSESEIKLYHNVNGSRVLSDFNVYDLNNNSLVDYVEWVVPHLGNQTYELIIEISKAEHLDFNRSFIEDVYEYVNAQDENWIEIPAGNYLRVTFETELDSSRDITLYARTGNLTINGERVSREIYEKKKRIDEIQGLLNG